MRALDRKLLRELGQLRGQVITIALVVACGITAYVTMQSTWVSLGRAKTAFYLRYGFGDVFAHAKRAPERVGRDLEAIPGVALVYTRLVETVTLPIVGRAQPPLAEVVSLPADGGVPPVGKLHLQAGRSVEPGRADEAVLLGKFADRYGLAPGDTIPVIVNGERRKVVIVGLGTSPEFLYALPAGSVGVDDERFAVLWMDRAAVASAFGLEGAFNDVVLRLQPGAAEQRVLREVDRLLDPYGGRTAVGRARQPSNEVLNEEMEQLRTWATVVPLIFLGISAFLVNVVLARLVQVQRPEIAALKAVGYSDREIGLHYLKLVTVVVLLGAVLGVVLGAWLGSALTGLYADIFRFPYAAYSLGVRVPLVGVLLSFAAAGLGAITTVRATVALPPAEALRPPSPSAYRPLLIERLGMSRLISPAGRMVVRELERRPLRTVLSVVGIATGIGTLVVGRFGEDAFQYLIDIQFSRVSREDLSVVFTQPVPERAVRELAHLAGVRRAEGIRAVPVRVESSQRSREVAFLGYPAQTELRQVISRTSLRPVPLPPDGLLLTKTLGTLLDVRAGDSITVKVLEGDRQTYRMPVAGLIDELMGLQGHIRLDALERRLNEPPSVSMALLQIDRGSEEAVIRRLADLPQVASITSRPSVIRTLRQMNGRSMAVVTLVLTAFAVTIAVGVVYNNARVALSMRSRDLASLRVLGFTRGEISRVLLGELAVQVALAIPLGLVFGKWLTILAMSQTHAERYRFPATVSVRTYAFAILVIAAASVVTGLIVRRELDRLDLVGVLKTRE